MTANEPLSKVLIGISCFDLISSDLLSKSDPQISVKEYTSNQWIEIYKTEKIMNNLNPSFNEFEKDYFFEFIQKLRFEIYDVDKHNKNSAVERGDFLGQFTASLAQLTRAGRTTQKLKDFNGKDLKRGTIEINIREIKSFREQLELSFSASNLPKKGKIFAKDPSTCLNIESVSYSKKWKTVYTSNAVQNNKNPVYKTFNIKMYKLTINEGQLEDKIRISVSKAEKSSSNYGSVTISISELIDAANTNSQKSWEINNSAETSYINLISCVVNRCYTFVDYIRDRLEINLTVAIDFTASNGDPSKSNSLHYLNGRGNYLQNDYTQAIDAVGRVVEEYDTDKKFPVFGFGAKLPPDFSFVSHDFAINMDSQYPDCFGVDGILEAYRNCIPCVQLYGPTNFEPVIRKMIHLASQPPLSSKNYFILLILTDGVITDLRETVDAIIEASELPMSIIIIGVGNADFDEMNFLDSDDRQLRSADGRRMSKRDIVQFVPFNQFRSTSLEMLARHVLAELPTQVTQYYESHRIYPNIN